MKDIFISHSSRDAKITSKICGDFEDAGFTCWVSYRLKDLEPGEDYTQRITRAVDECRIFVVLLSNNAVSSDQVRQEIILANERQRFGLRIYPVIVDDSMDMEEMHRKLGYVLAGKEMVRWSSRGAWEELRKQVSLVLNPGLTDKKAELITKVPGPSHLIGRSREMTEIADLIRHNRRVWICGMGGIGKTALLESLCSEDTFTDYYHRILYLSVETCLLRTLNQEDKLVMRSPVLQGKRKDLSDYEYAMLRLSLLENSLQKDDLVIIDDLSSENDPLLDRFLKMNASLVIASRKRAPAGAGFSYKEIRELDDPRSIFELFSFYYGESLPEEEYEPVIQLMEGIRFHTMTIVLLARQIRYFGKKPSDYYDRNQLRAERSRNLKQMIGGGLYDEEITRMYEHLFDIFDAGNMTQDERKVMKTLGILPAEGIQKHLYLQMVGESCIQVLNQLEEMGWVQTDSDGNVFLHPLVRDVVGHELDIHMDDPDVSAFIGVFIRMISNAWNQSYEKNLPYRDLALSIYYQFPQPTLARYKDYLILSKVLWVLNYIEISLEIRNKVRALFDDKYTSDYYAAEKAEAYLETGFTLHVRGDYERAADSLETAVRLYGNKYAAALSHLAQAYMESGNRKLEEIEPFLRDSLAIRRRYYPGTISEAAACHLYAKTLSAYETNLEYAIELEKRAHRLFSALQPGTGNHSSSTYMLGWLYVQTAQDEEDIEMGIDLLEEGRRLRLVSRQNALDPWMEDIYLKLGLSYMKCGRYRQAKDCLELLLDLRKEKYKKNPSGRLMAETYQLLQEVYQQLGDKEGQKRCRKFLRYYV